MAKAIRSERCMTKIIILEIMEFLEQQNGREINVISQLISLSL
jgi:hypothetical protein